MSDQRCIYCSPNQPARKPYTDEHVVPEAFGKFRNNLTLPEGVCGDCNQEFGDTIDRFLGRGSAEAVKRLDYRIKPPEKARDILRKRISFSLSTDDQFDGLKLEYGSEQGELVVLLVPQVGFPRRDHRGWIYMTEYELADMSKSLPKDAETKSTTRLIFNSETMKQRLIQLLKARGIESQESGEEGFLPTQVGQEVEVEILAQLDDMVLRAIAKIAFNYLTKIMGIDFVVRADFDAIRAYIRYGKKLGYQVVKISQQPILTLDSIRLHQTNGHLLTLEWSSNGRNLIGCVSLFNFATYQVTLVQNYPGIWRPIRSGHHFNIEKLEVQPLLGISSQLLR